MYLSKETMSCTDEGWNTAAGILWTKLPKSVEAMAREGLSRLSLDERYGHRRFGNDGLCLMPKIDIKRLIMYTMKKDDRIGSLVLVIFGERKYMKQEKCK